MTSRHALRRTAAEPGSEASDRYSFPPRILRYLSAADGYLDLQMPARALAELDRMGDPGPLEAPAAFLRGEALKAQQRYTEAIEPLQRAAKLIPAPHNQVAWQSLAECFRLRGDATLAEIVQMFAETTGEPATDEELLEISIEIDPASLDYLLEEFDDDEFDSPSEN